MNEQNKKAFEFAQDSVKQLMTLSTGIIGLTVTFSKDIFSTPNNCQQSLLVNSWILFLISIFLGLWTLLALTGTLGKINDPKIYSPNLTG